MKVDEALLDRLAEFDTPTICNTIELFEIQPRTTGYAGAAIKACFPKMSPAVGFAATASFRASSPGRTGTAYTGIEEQLAAFEALPGRPFVVIQDLDHPVKAAVFGEVMCSSYQAFGAAGLMTNGAGRDLLQVESLGFPVFTGGTLCSHGYCHLLHLGMPVTLDGLVVNEGELLHADANGIAMIPFGLEEPIATLAGKFVVAEEIILEYVKSESPKSIDEYRDRRAAFQLRINGLKAEALEMLDAVQGDGSQPG